MLDPFTLEAAIDYYDKDLLVLKIVNDPWLAGLLESFRKLNLKKT